MIWAKSLSYEMILTNFDDLITDISNYVFKYHVSNHEIMNRELLSLKEYIIQKQEEGEKERKKADKKDLIIIFLIFLLIIVCYNHFLLILQFNKYQ